MRTFGSMTLGLFLRPLLILCPPAWLRVEPQGNTYFLPCHTSAVVLEQGTTGDRTRVYEKDTFASQSSHAISLPMARQYSPFAHQHRSPIRRWRSSTGNVPPKAHNLDTSSGILHLPSETTPPIETKSQFVYPLIPGRNKLLWLAK